MSQETTIDFKSASSDFELLDLIRLRYQIFANDIASLRGILTGYCLSKDNYEQNVRDFAKHLTDIKNINPYAISWDKIISIEAENSEYEIPIFFNYLDAYRNTKHEVLGIVELSWEQRNFDFRRRLEKVSVDFPELPLKPPHKLKAVRIPGVSVHAFYYDENGKKYYEQCLRDFDYLQQWAKECFNINESLW